MTPVEQLVFPSRRRQVTAAWEALYFEPMIGSGERICVAILAVSEADFALVPVVGVERLNCLYGKEGLDFIQLLLRQTFDNINQTFESSENRRRFVNSEDESFALRFSFDGIFSGPRRHSSANSINEVAKNGLMLCASLTERLADTSEETADAMTRKKLENNVRQVVTNDYPLWSHKFGIKRTLEANSRPVTFGFVGAHVAADFGYLDPTHLAPTVHYAKSNLLELSSLKRIAGELYSEKREHYQILLFVPRHDDPRYTDRQIESVQSALRTLTIEAEGHGLELFANDEIKQMANHLIHTENPRA